MKLIITRHGETYDNLEHLLTGQKDVELTEKGQQEAEELSKKLNNIDINIIYCSALKRTKDTISPYLKDKTIEINYTEDLKEMDLGKYN